MKQTLLIFLLLFCATAFAQTVYITKTGEKYHDEGCGYLKRSSISITLTEALERGYDACSVCKPPKSKAQVKSAPFYVETTAAGASVQCSGKTKKGTRCQRMTKDASGRCYQH